jgi:hypothetical protein
MSDEQWKRGDVIAAIRNAQSAHDLAKGKFPSVARYWEERLRLLNEQLARLHEEGGDE